MCGCKGGALGWRLPPAWCSRAEEESRRRGQSRWQGPGRVESQFRGEGIASRRRTVETRAQEAELHDAVARGSARARGGRAAWRGGKELASTIEARRVHGGRATWRGGEGIASTLGGGAARARRSSGVARWRRVRADALWCASNRKRQTRGVQFPKFAGGGLGCPRCARFGATPIWREPGGSRRHVEAELTTRKSKPIGVDRGASTRSTSTRAVFGSHSLMRTHALVDCMSVSPGRRGLVCTQLREHGPTGVFGARDGGRLSGDRRATFSHTPAHCFNKFACSLLFYMSFFTIHIKLDYLICFRYGITKIIRSYDNCVIRILFMGVDVK